MKLAVWYILLSLFLSPLLCAQQRQLGFKHISVEEGLSQNTVKAILKDGDGYMWFGTRDGLNKYDGYKITIYKHQSGKKKSLSDNFINTIYEDRQGNLWIGTAKGLDRFDRDSETFEHYAIGESAVNVKHIYQDKKDRMWLATYSGLYLFNPAEGTFRVYRQQENDPHSLIHDEVNLLAEDAEGNLWIATEGGLERFDVQNNVFTHYRHDPADAKSLPGDLVKAVFTDSRGNVWAGLRAGGVALYDPLSAAFIRYQHTESKGNTISHNDVACLAEGPDGKLWIGTENGGISVFDYTNNTFTAYQHDKYEAGSISHNSIHSLYKDNQGNMWAGSWAGGVNLYSPFLTKFTHYKKFPGTEQVAIDAIGGDSEGNIWLGLEEEGLLHFDPEKETFTKYKNPNEARFDVSVYGVAELNKDTLALASRRGGLALFAKKAAQFTHFLPQKGSLSGIAGHEKNAVLVDREGNIWTGDWYKGLNSYNPQTKSFTNYLHDPKNPHSISHNRVFALHEDREGNLWIGTDGGGLDLFDRKTGHFTHFTHDQNNEHSLSHNTVFSIMEDSRGRLWVGTYGGGLNLLDKKSGHFTAFTQKDGLPNDVVNAMLEDSNGNLWLSTNKGLSRFNPQTRIFHNFTVEEGLQGNEFTRNAAYKSPDGTMYFAGPKGLNSFHPDSIRSNPNAPPVYITDFQIFNESVLPGAEESPLAKSISQTRQITLDYRQSVFSFEFAALNYTLPEKNNYFYTLEGFDQQWNKASGHRKASYTNIEPGTYTFRVKASNNDGVWNGEGAFVDILITPPFWKRWWAYLFYVVVFAFLLYLFYRYTIQWEKLNNKLKVERITRDKERELNKLKLKFFTNISHEIRTPVTLLLGAVNRIGEEGNNSTLGLKQQALLEIRKNGDHLLQLVNELLDFRRLDSGGIKLKAAEGNFVKFVKEISLSFGSLAADKEIRFEFFSDKEEIALWYDRDQMEKVVYNLLSNAFKFTEEGGTIKVNVTHNEQHVYLTVEDTGKGIPENTVKKIFKRFYQNENELTHSKEEGFGIGLSIARGVVKLHSGEIYVESEVNKGSRFVVKLLPGTNHLSHEQRLTGFKDSENVDNYVMDGQNLQMDQVLVKDFVGATILIVEDNEGIRSYLAELLQPFFQVKAASQGVEGLGIAVSEIPDLIISDVMMPEMDGISLTRALKKDMRTSHIPVILLTAHTSLIYKKEGLEIGADDYVTKPFDETLLKTRIINLLKNRQLLREKYQWDLSTEPKDVAITSPDQAFLAALTQLLEENLENAELKADFIAREMGMSHSVIYKKIKSLTGLSLIEFIRDYRLKRAAQLLSRYPLSVLDVCVKVGFSDRKYFSKLFKNKFGTPPSEFSKKADSAEN